MKLSEILGWEKRKDIQYESWPILTSCDREIDREALAIIIKEVGGVLINKLFARAMADHIISTMPTWLKRIEG